MGCDDAEKTRLQSEQISIHAPIVGCDRYCLRVLLVLSHFNPRTHRGVRRIEYRDIENKEKFQSTHPSWGATVCKDFNYADSKNFNPRTHRGVRLRNLYLHISIPKISIHAPIVGCDQNKLDAFRDLVISIHAPIVGCDQTPPKYLSATDYFNPRTHRGVRLSGDALAFVKLMISIHAPIVGCDYLR